MTGLKIGRYIRMSPPRSAAATEARVAQEGGGEPCPYKGERANDFFAGVNLAVAVINKAL